MLTINQLMISKQRVISVFLGWGIAFGVLILSSTGFFSLLICSIAMLAFNEFLRIYHVNENIVLYRVSLIIFTVLDISALFPALNKVGFGLNLAPLVILVIGLIMKKIGERGVEQITIVIVGLVYVGFLLNYLFLIRLLPNGRELLIVLSVGTWGRDLGAFLFGRLIQSGHTILPEVSARKTYEGAIGGLVFTILLVSSVARWLIPAWTLVDLIATGSLIGVLGQVGDLVESWLKRNAGVTDSSQIIPGQGGILDSFDSFIFTAPAIYLYAVLRMTAS